VPVLTHRLYPELKEADVQLPELFDFSVTARHQVRSPSVVCRRLSVNLSTGKHINERRTQGSILLDVPGVDSGFNA
jgi:hypothetical protein